MSTIKEHLNIQQKHGGKEDCNIKDINFTLPI